jgi:hypothetical protein
MTPVKNKETDIIKNGWHLTPTSNLSNFLPITELKQIF